MWHRASVDMKILTKRILFWFFQRFYFPLKLGWEILCSLQPLQPAMNLFFFKNLCGLFQLKITFFPVQPEKGLSQATAVCSQDSRTYEIGSFWLGVLISQCQCQLGEWYISAWNTGLVSHSKTQACATSPAADSRVTTPLMKGKTKQNLHSGSLPVLFLATSYTCGFPAEAIWISVFSFRKVP